MPQKLAFAYSHRVLVGASGHTLRVYEERPSISPLHPAAFFCSTHQRLEFLEAKELSPHHSSPDHNMEQTGLGRRYMHEHAFFYS